MPRGFMDFFNHTRGPPRVNIHHDITSGVARPSLGYHDTIKAQMTAEWVINASPTHLGLLHHLQGLQYHLQGLQHHHQGLQHRQQGGRSKIQPCGYKDLVNWVKGALRNKPSLYGLQGTGCEDTGIIHTCALQVGLGGINDYSWGHCKSILASMTTS